MAFWEITPVQSRSRQLDGKRALLIFTGQILSDGEVFTGRRHRLKAVSSRSGGNCDGNHSPPNKAIENRTAPPYDVCVTSYTRT